jgi:hypothetical protein
MSLVDSNGLVSGALANLDRYIKSNLYASLQLFKVPLNPAPDGTYRTACNRLYFFSKTAVRHTPCQFDHFLHTIQCLLLVAVMLPDGLID